MYISFDYTCTQCRSMEGKLVRKEEMDNQTCRCGGRQVRLPPATRTTFRHADTKLKD